MFRSVIPSGTIAGSVVARSVRVSLHVKRYLLESETILMVQNWGQAIAQCPVQRLKSRVDLHSAAVLLCRYLSLDGSFSASQMIIATLVSKALICCCAKSALTVYLSASV